MKPCFFQGFTDYRLCRRLSRLDGAGWQTPRAVMTLMDQDVAARIAHDDGDGWHQQEIIADTFSDVSVKLRNTHVSFLSTHARAEPKRDLRIALARCPLQLVVSLHSQGRRRLFQQFQHSFLPQERHSQSLCRHSVANAIIETRLVVDGWPRMLVDYEEETVVGDRVKVVLDVCDARVRL